MSIVTDHGTDERHAGSSPGLWATWRDSVSPRTAAYIVGVLALQMGFILSYVGAFHSPSPHRIPLAVVAPGPAAAQLTAELNALPSHPFEATATVDQSTAERQVRDLTTAAALIVNPAGTTDTLLVASAGGASVSSAVTTLAGQVATSQNRTLQMRDIVPAQPGDSRGMTGFYLVIGWIIGGYLVAALLGVARGARPANPHRTLLRLASIAPYAFLSGLGGALIVDPILGALTGHFIALWGLGALLVATSAAVTLAFQVLFGVLGIGVTVLVFVVLGNPTAGGASQAALLPPFWRALSEVLPNAAGTDAVRRIVYFGAHGLTTPLIILAIYLTAGIALAILGSYRHQRHQPRLPNR